MAVNKPFAFVIMPFDASYDDVYRLGIQGAADAVGLDAKRLDDQLFDRSMLEQIYSEIDRADLIIADMSDRNANVFYEAGYADAKKKLIIFLTRDEKDIPFDLKHRPHIVYGSSIVYLQEELTKKLQWAVNEVQERTRKPLRLNVQVGSVSFGRSEYSDSGEVEFRIEIHNISDQVVQDIDAFYLFTSEAWTVNQRGVKCATTKIKAGPSTIVRHLISPGFTSVPPNDWRPVDISATRILWGSWYGDKIARVDKHTVEGMLKLELHTPAFQLKHDQRIKTTFEYDDIPF